MCQGELRGNCDTKHYNREALAPGEDEQLLPRNYGRLRSGRQFSFTCSIVNMLDESKLASCWI